MSKENVTLSIEAEAEKKSLKEIRQELVRAKSNLIKQKGKAFAFGSKMTANQLFSQILSSGHDTLMNSSTKYVDFSTKMQASQAKGQCAELLMQMIYNQSPDSKLSYSIDSVVSTMLNAHLLHQGSSKSESLQTVYDAIDSINIKEKEGGEWKSKAKAAFAKDAGHILDSMEECCKMLQILQTRQMTESLSLFTTNKKV